MVTFCEVFQRLIAEIAQQRPTVFMVDGLDQADDFSPPTLNWIPSRLPDNVKIVLTTSEGPRETGPNVAAALRARLEGGCFMRMPDLDTAEARSMVMAGVVQFNHSVNAVIQECVLRSVQECKLPLHAKVNMVI